MENCYFCDKEGIKEVNIDIDLPDISICNSEKCDTELFLKLNWKI